MWLDMCDRLGVMVVGGMPIECMRLWPTVTPHLRDRIEDTVRSAILRDRNRACVVQWEIFNEIHRREMWRLKHSTSMLARRLDPTRLILDESGGFAGGANIYLHTSSSHSDSTTSMPTPRPDVLVSSLVVEKPLWKINRSISRSESV